MPLLKTILFLNQMEGYCFHARLQISLFSRYLDIASNLLAVATIREPFDYSLSGVKQSSRYPNPTNRTIFGRSNMVASHWHSGQQLGKTARIAQRSEGLRTIAYSYYNHQSNGLGFRNVGAFVMRFVCGHAFYECPTLRRKLADFQFSKAPL